jgi:hypothetical protein
MIQNSDEKWPYHLALDVELLKLNVWPNDMKERNTFAATNAIQVRIDERC